MSTRDVLIKKVYGEVTREASIIRPQEINEVLIHVNSLNCLPGGTPSRFTCKLGRAFQPDQVNLLSFNVSNVVYNLRDSIILEENGFPPVTITPPAGAYDYWNWPAIFSAFLTANSPSGATYTCTLDLFTLKATIASTTLFKFNNVTPRNGTYYALGFNSSVPEPVQVFALSQISTGHWDFLALRGNILVKISEFVSNPIGDTLSSYTFVIPAVSITTQNNSFTASGSFHQSYKHTMDSRIEAISVELLTEAGFPLPVLGGNTTLVLSYTTRS